LDEFTDLYVIQSAGRANEAELKRFYESELKPSQQDRVKVYGYLNDVYLYSGAADLVITRAGATNLAEFALQAKACIVVPNPYLTSGHQLKNANYLAEKQAAVVIDEDELTDDPNRLAKQVSQLLKAPKELQNLAANLADFAKPDASLKLSSLIMEQVKSS
jgi:UDP-N-acetylglucosamine--N-acetylmuramyl-(pentapeptide) pyrophosphoryl-undecaprenol N-acetylglucosamine transferase